MARRLVLKNKKCWFFVSYFYLFNIDGRIERGVGNRVITLTKDKVTLEDMTKILENLENYTKVVILNYRLVSKDFCKNQ